MPGTCNDGVCQITPKKCDDGDPTTKDFCDAAAGKCKTVPFPAANWTGCTSDDDCGGANACEDWICNSLKTCVLSPVVCNDINPCTADSCDPEVGCEFVVDANCTLGCKVDTDCFDNDLCTADTCNVDNGTCVNKYDKNCGKIKCTKDIDCYDKNACTYEVCFNGFCVSKPVLCNDGKQCTQDTEPYDAANDPDNKGPVPACDPTSGCSLVPFTDCDGTCTGDADCDTGSLCAPGQCVNGKCKVTEVKCNDPGAGKQAFCDHKTGQCKTITKPGWTGCEKPEDCDDGNPCTIDDCEEEGTCIYVGKNCNDMNPCTTDSCDPQGTGCSFVAIEGCQGCSKNSDCNDLDKCTTSTCTTETGTCKIVPIVGCKGCNKLTQKFDCNDDDECTEDLCGVNGQCYFVPISIEIKPECKKTKCLADFDCIDADLCTIDRCKPDGKCTHELPKCYDNLNCTKDGPAICSDSVPGCPMYIDINCGGQGCVTSADCKIPDKCVTGKCSQGTCSFVVKECDDDDNSTLDYCSPKSGLCVHKKVEEGKTFTGCVPDDDLEGNSEECTDGNACTMDFCIALSDNPTKGQCWYVFMPCNDFNPCTVDACDETNGCSFVEIENCKGCNKSSDCDDGDYCTEDLCGLGKKGQCTYEPAQDENHEPLCP